MFHYNELESILTFLQFQNLLIEKKFLASKSLLPPSMTFTNLHGDQSHFVWLSFCKANVSLTAIYEKSFKILIPDVK